MTGDWSQLLETIPSVCNGNSKTCLSVCNYSKTRMLRGEPHLCCFTGSISTSIYTSNHFLSVVVVVPVASISPPKPCWTCGGAAEKPGLFLRVSSEGLSLLISQMWFLLPIVSEDGAMKELTQFLTAFHKRRLMWLSQAHTCVHKLECAHDFEKIPERHTPSLALFHWWKNRCLIDI